MPGHRGTVPDGLSFRRRLFQCGQHLLAKVRVIVPRLARPRTICQTGQSLPFETPPPIDHRIRPHFQIPSDAAHRFPLQTVNDYLCSLNQARFLSPAPRPLLQRLSVLLRTIQRWCRLGHCNPPAQDLTPYLLLMQLSTRKG